MTAQQWLAEYPARQAAEEAERKVREAVFVPWVVPSARQVSDLRWLAGRAWLEQGSPWVGGVIAAAGWVDDHRYGPGPITGRTEKPVTRTLAEAECWAALAAGDEPGGASFPLESVCAELGVDYWPPKFRNRVYVDGAWRTLRWLLGAEGQAAPLRLPVRDADGSVPTAEQLYAQAVERDPFLAGSPEQRQALRSRVDAEAHRSRALAELIEQVERSG